MKTPLKNRGIGLVRPKKGRRAFEPARENLSSQVERSIRDALMSARFHPGEHLNIRALAEMLGTSATPIREALFRLTAEHAIEMHPGHSAKVPVIDADQYAELCLIRKAIEGFAAEMAATRITAGELTQLGTVLKRFNTACDNSQFDQTLSFSREFRFGVYRAAKMPILMTIIEGLWLRSGPTFRILSLVNDPELGITYQHALNALAKRDGSGARRAVEDAISLGSGRLMKYLEEQPKEGSTVPRKERRVRRLVRPGAKSADTPFAAFTLRSR
jgi:GntR family transcriptional regulator, colanic acid and biofilm gene transcriptional regulator